MGDYPTDDNPLIFEPERPCALVNTSSGERSAAIFVTEQLKKRFGADSVFDLFPEKGKPPAIEEAKAFVAARKPDLLVVAGGDGTVSLGLDIVDAVRAAKKIDDTTAPIAVIPMGTGNDLSRSLGFGGGYKKPLANAEALFDKVIRRLYMARPCDIDRFSLNISVMEKDDVPTANAGAVNGHQRAAAADKKERRSFEEDGDAEEHHHPYSGDGHAQQQQRETPSSSPASATGATSSSKSFEKVFTNYFSIGFDAKVAKQFGDFRDNNPEMCQSRVMNKMWYGCFGCNAMCCSSTLPKKRVSFTLDGKKLKVPSSTKSIVVQNMITYAGGNVLWEDGHHRFEKPAVDDGKVEVVALEGVWHMVGVGTQTRSGLKIGQGASIVLYAPAHFTMQYDGEPIAAMGTSDQMVKIVVQFKSRSLGSRVQPAKVEEEGGQVAALHSEK